MTTAQLTKPDVRTVGDAHQANDAMAGGIAPCLPFLRRMLKHPRLKHYDRLVTLAIAVNLGWALHGTTADLRSANGVYVQGRRIRGSAALDDCDRTRICHHEFVFEIEPRD